MGSGGDKRGWIRRVRLCAGLLLALVLQTASHAQHGHPLVGSWSGDWGPNPEQRHRVLLLLRYDGERITGVINPGPSPVPLTSATLDPETWSVRLEAQAPGEDAGGYLIEGRIENLGSVTERAIAGTWVQGAVRGDFRVVLN